MKVSVIIPYHNERKYIDDCMDSLTDQTVQDFEVIVVCDRCEKEAVAELRERETSFPMTVLELDEGEGTAAARNMGLKNSKGEYLLFLDCDDYLETYAIEELLSRSEGMDIVYAKRVKTWYGRRIYYDNGKQLEERHNSKKKDDDEPLDTSFLDEFPEWLKTFYTMVYYGGPYNEITALGILIRSDLVKKNELLFDTSYRYMTDLTFIVSAFCRTEKVTGIDKCLYIKRRHNDPINLPSLNQIQDEKTKYIEASRAYVEIKKNLEGQDEEAAVAVDRKFIKYYVKKIAPFYITGEKAESDELYEAASKCIPMIKDKAKKTSMRYTRKLLKVSESAGPEQIAKKVARHSSRQVLRRILTRRSAMKKFLYRKVFTKMKMKDNLVVFESFFGRNYSDSPKYIFEYLNKNYPGEYKNIWICSEKKWKGKLPFPAKKIKRFSIRYFYYMGRAKYHVFNGRQPLYFIKREGNVFLQTWHGTPLKKLVFDMDEVTSAAPLYKKHVYIQTRSWDYLVAPNQFSEDVFRHAFMYDGNMLETGYPRNDILHLEDKSALTSEIKRELNIPEDKKVILYAPTWRDDEFYSSAKYSFNLQLDLDKMKKELGDEYVVLLRTHYFVVDSLDLSAYAGFAYNGSTYDDIARLYLISDILITDYSSVFFDYANLKRPMLFFTYDLEKYRDVLRGFYIDVEEELPGPMLFDTDEVIDSIKNLPRIEKEYGEKYDKFYQKFCAWEDGNATRKVIEKVFGK